MSGSQVKESMTVAKKKPALRRIRIALTISLVINALMIFMGIAAGMVQPLSILGKVSDWIAAPTGFLIGSLIRPKTPSATSVISASLAGFVFSIVFYAAIAWLVLILMASRRQVQSPTPEN